MKLLLDHTSDPGEIVTAVRSDRGDTVLMRETVSSNGACGSIEAISEHMEETILTGAKTSFHTLYSRQSRRMSVVETLCDVGSGYAFAWPMTYFVLPAWGYAYSPRQAFEITAAYTAVSIIRKYVWRRFFEWWQRRGSEMVRRAFA